MMIEAVRAMLQLPVLWTVVLNLKIVIHRRNEDYQRMWTQTWLV